MTREHLLSSSDTKSRPGRIQLTSFSGNWTADGANALVDVNLEAGPGELVAVIGPVGSGKVGSHTNTARMTFMTFVDK